MGHQYVPRPSFLPSCSNAAHATVPRRCVCSHTPVTGRGRMPSGTIRSAVRASRVLLARSAQARSGLLWQSLSKHVQTFDALCYKNAAKAKLPFSSSNTVTQGTGEFLQTNLPAPFIYTVVCPHILDLPLRLHAFQYMSKQEIVTPACTTMYP